MITTSPKWKEWSKEYGVFHIRAILRGGSTLYLSDEDFMVNSVSFTDDISGMDRITLGSTVMNKFNATLNNFSGKFDIWDWNEISVDFGLTYDWSENLFDGTNTMMNFGLDSATGNPVLRPAWVTSDYISISERAECKSSETYVCCYNSSKTFISTVYPNTDHAFKTPPNTEYVRFCFPTTETDPYIQELEQEWINHGVYTIERPKSTGNTIQIQCWDKMNLLNKDFTSFINGVEFPIYLQDFFIALCAYCGLDFGGTDFGYYTLSSFPQYEKPATCRQAISWFCEINGAYARIEPSTGMLELKTFELSNRYLPSNAISGWLNDSGSIYTPVDEENPMHSDYIYMQSGKEYSIYPSPADDNIYVFNTSKAFQYAMPLDGESTFTAPISGYYQFNTHGDQRDYIVPGDDAYFLENIQSQTFALDHVDVTGLRVWVYFPDDPSDHDQWTQWGSDGYVLPVIDNPFLTYEDYVTWGNHLWEIMEYFSVQPFEAYIWGDPSMEAGDTVLIFNQRSNQYYNSIITSISFQLNGITKVAFNALTPQELFEELESLDQ